MRGRYKIKTIADLAGFSPTLLRAWERRYEILEPERTESGHRLYTDDDLRVLREIKRRLGTGRTIGEVVAVGRPGLLGSREPVSLDTLNRQLIQAALEFDEVTLQRLLDQAFASFSAATVLDQVLETTCHHMGHLWASGEATVAHEHLLSSVLGRRLQRLLDFAGPVPGRPVLCACLPDEQHEMGIMVVTYRLRCLGVGAMCLGRGLPVSDLAAACKASNPTHVFLSVSRTGVLDEHLAKLGELARSQRMRIVLGGRAVSDEEAPRIRAHGLEPWLGGRPLDDLVQLLT